MNKIDQRTHSWTKTDNPLKISQTPREKLLQRLDEGLKTKFTLIQAPAGYGKTSGMVSWLDTNQIPYGWYTFSKNTCSPDNFVRSLDNIIESRYADTEERLYQHCENQSAGSYFSSIKKISDFTRKAQTNFILVFDDCQNINHAVIHSLINHFIDNLIEPPYIKNHHHQGIHLYFISRNTPEISLSKLRLMGELTEILEDDFRMSDEETFLLLTDNIESEISLKEATLLNRRTEGWIAAQIFFLLSFKQHRTKSIKTSLNEFTGNSQYIVRYLKEEVLADLPAEYLTFIFKIFCLDRFNTELCELITGHDQCAGILDFLETNLSFIRSSNDQPGWYWTAPLIQEALFASNQNISKLEIQDTKIRAAIWFEKHGDYIDSLKCWLSVKQYDPACLMIEKIAHQLLSLGKAKELKELIDLLPESMSFDHPWINIYRAWISLQLNITGSELLINQAEKHIKQFSSNQRCRAIDTQEMWGNIYAQRMMVAIKHRDAEKTYQYGQKALTILSDKEMGLKGVVLNTLSRGFFMNGQVDRALNTLHTSKHILQESGDFYGYVQVLNNALDILLVQGRLQQAAQIAQEIIEIKNEIDNLGINASIAYSNLGTIQYEWNDIQESTGNLKLGCERSRDSHISDFFSSRLSLLNIYIRSGEFEQAAVLLDEIDPFYKDPELMPWLETRFLGCKLRFFSATGDIQGYKKIVAKHNHLFQQSPDIMQEPFRLSLAAANLTLGNYDICQDIISCFLPYLKISERYCSLLITLSILAIAQLKKGNMVAAQSTILQALKIGEKEEYISAFLEMGEPMLELLVGLVKSGRMQQNDPHDVFLNDVISAFFSPAQNRRRHDLNSYPTMKQGSLISQISMETLTFQEKKVLELLEHGNSNQDIANCLSVSINTVKKHTSNIYNKLGVHKRGQAIRRARQLDIL